MQLQQVFLHFGIMLHSNEGCNFWPPTRKCQRKQLIIPTWEFVVVSSILSSANQHAFLQHQQLIVEVIKMSYAENTRNCSTSINIETYYQYTSLIAVKQTRKHLCFCPLCDVRMIYCENDMKTEVPQLRSFECNLNLNHILSNNCHNFRMYELFNQNWGRQWTALEPHEALPSL